MHAIIFVFVLCILIFIWISYNLKRSKKSLQETFKSLSYDILAQNNQSFMNLAKASFDKYHEGFKTQMDHKQKELEQILNPLKESLDKIDDYTKEVERQRYGAYSSLKNQIEMLLESEKILRQETANLTKALKSPNIRGSWGQIHLRRVIELAGLSNNCDFYEQKTQIKEDKMYRPDLVVRLPGEKQIIIDAKTPIEAYLEAQEMSDDLKKQKLKSHALNLKKHIFELSSKEYYAKFDFAFEYVILFLPAEAFLSSAVKIDPNLLEIAASKNVIIATPTTLIAILKTIAHLWKEDSISKNAKDIAKVGKELYDRLITMNSHFVKLGKNLSTSVDAYNQTIASFNSRVMPSAKKLEDIGLSHKKTVLEELSKTCNINKID
jgi:DNA recombination protein RmuC